MLLHFPKNIHFTKLIKAADRLREFNFRRVPGDPNPIFHVDVPDDRGNRITFRMEKEANNHWRIMETTLPQWVASSENQLHEMIEEEIQH